MPGQRNLQLHLDGARIFNAAVKLAVDVSELTRHLSIRYPAACQRALERRSARWSAASRDFIREARRWRKVCGRRHAAGRHPGCGRSSRPRTSCRKAGRRPSTTPELLARGLQDFEAVAGGYRERCRPIWSLPKSTPISAGTLPPFYWREASSSVRAALSAW